MDIYIQQNMHYVDLEYKISRGPDISVENCSWGKQKIANCHQPYYVT